MGVTAMGPAVFFRFSTIKNYTNNAQLNQEMIPIRENNGVSQQQIQMIIIVTKPPGDIAYLKVFNHLFSFFPY